MHALYVYLFVTIIAETTLRSFAQSFETSPLRVDNVGLSPMGAL